MKFRSLKEKLSLIISLVVFIAFVIILVYHNTLIKRQSDKLAAEFMKNNYLQFSSVLQNEFERIKSKNDVLALVFSKTVNDNNINEIEKLLKSLVNNNPSIYKISFAYFDTHFKVQDSSNHQEQLKLKFLNLLKTDRGTKQNTQAADDPLKLELFKKNLYQYDRGVVFEIQHHKASDYFPVLTPVFSGKKYIGYIETCISIDWINETLMLNSIGLPENFKIYLSSDNQLIASNSKQLIIGESVQSVCPDCAAETGIILKNRDKNNYIYCENILKNENFVGKLKLCFVASYDDLSGLISYNPWQYFIVGFIILIIGLLIIYFTIAYITRPFKQLISFAQKVAIGDFECEQKNMPIKQRDEIGQLQLAFRAISEFLKEITDLSKSIAAGNFSKKLALKSDKDILSLAINQMSESLQSKSEQDMQSKAEEEKQKWINKGLGQISEVLKRNQDDIRNLANKLIKNLVDFLDVALGGIYMKEIDEAGETLYRLVAAYAYSEEKYINRSFHAGESLVGSCVSEQRIIYMSSIPEGYIKIMSGIGESVPKSLILIPLIYNNEIFGVIEMASLKEISQKEQEFLQIAADNIASTLSLTQISSQTGILLEKTQKQARELELRDIEMKATLKKMSKLQEETAQKEAAMRAKLTALNNSLLIVEYTVEGILYEANDKFLNTMGYSLKELKGRNVLDLLNEAERRELLQIIETVKQGNFYETILRRHTKHEKEKWFIATYTPVLNDEGATVSILFFATDITRTIRKEQSLFTQISELSEENHNLTREKYQLEKQLLEQNNKIQELMAHHKLIENQLTTQLDEQKKSASETIELYEGMINEIIAEWQTHILNAEKIILNKKSQSSS